MKDKTKHYYGHVRDRKQPKNYMAVDQHGRTFHNLGPHPRKELMRRLGTSHAARMYRDKKDGRTVHIGWVIAGRWLSLYEVTPVEKVVR